MKIESLYFHSSGSIFGTHSHKPPCSPCAHKVSPTEQVLMGLWAGAALCTRSLTLGVPCKMFVHVQSSGEDPGAGVGRQIGQELFF